MKIFLAALLLILAMVQPGTADADHASEASVKELMMVMQSHKLVDGVMAKVDAMMQAATQQALAGEKITPEQQKIIDDNRAKSVAVFKDEMKWETIEPTFIELYQKSFIQQELDGMLAFYKSPVL